MPEVGKGPGQITVEAFISGPEGSGEATVVLVVRDDIGDMQLGALTQVHGLGQAALLALGSVCAGIAFGSMWPHLVVLASELFGSSHLAANYLFFDGGCGAVGTLLLANLLPTFFYSRAATDDDEGGSGAGSGPDLTNRTCAGSSSTCLGAQCFLPTHSIIAGLCLLAVVASAVIARRSAGLYRQIKRNADLIARAAVGARRTAPPVAARARVRRPRVGV
jgi:hypothetical protein